MDILPIRTDDDHRAALGRIEELWGADPCTQEGNELDVLLDLVEHYEDRHFPIEPMEPVDLLKAHMEATGRTQADSADCSDQRRAPRKS